MIPKKGLVKHTPQTITDIDEFKQSLEEIRKFGYAFEDEEEEIGVRCIGVPIFNGENVVASVSIVGHTSMLDLKNVNQLVKQLQQTAKFISKELGTVNKI